MTKKIFLFCILIILCSNVTQATEQKIFTIEASTFTKIYDPSVGEKKNWYINDHTFIQGPDGTWHMFGITHEEPANPLDEKHFAHATAKSLTQTPWVKQPFALSADSNWGEELLWAPYVFLHDGLYYMYYCAGDKDNSKYKIHLATSKDLWSWQRHPKNPMLIDGYDARDPFILRVGNQWVMYYTANSNPKGGHHIVAYRLSDDLIHWGEKHTAFRDASKGTYGGPTESPYVVKRGDDYYLFIGPRGGYVGTLVLRSKDPFHFDIKDQVGFIPSHAAEVILNTDGKWFVSHSGWGQGGLFLSPLLWK